MIERIKKYKEDNYLDSYWEIPAEILLDLTPSWLHRIRARFDEFYYYHCSAIKNKRKYGSYFGNSDAWSLCDSLDQFIAPRLRSLIDMKLDGGDSPLITKERMELSKLPKSWFTPHDKVFIFKKGKWTETLKLILKGIPEQDNEYTEPLFYPNNDWNAPLDAVIMKKYNKREKQIIKDRKHSLFLLGLFYDSLWD